MLAITLGLLITPGNLGSLMTIHLGVCYVSSYSWSLNRPGGEGGNGPPEGKFMKLGGKVNFGVLSSKIDVIPEKRGAISLVLVLTVLS